MKSLIEYINESKNTNIIYDNNGMPVGYKVNDKLVVSFIDKHYRVDELVNSSISYYKYGNVSIKWGVPSAEDMTLLFRKIDELNDVISSLPDPSQFDDDFEDEDDIPYRPQYEVRPYSFTKNKLSKNDWYMTSKKKNDTDWYAVKYNGDTDYCSWVESEKYNTRIIGYLK